MDDPPGQEKSAVAIAQAELAAVQAEVAAARVELRQLRRAVEDCKARLNGADGFELMAVNQQLVLALLRAQNIADASARSQASRFIEGNETLVAHELRHRQQQEANTQLVLAVLSAQELQAAAEKAQQRQKDLLAFVAHELRHPLGPISNAAFVLGKIASEEPLLARMQRIIETQASHMARLVNDLVDVSRADSGKLRLERKLTEITAVVAAACEASRPAMDARGQAFETDIAMQPIEMDADPVRLAQIVVNLLDNASKYTPKGGLIQLTLRTVANRIEITVADNGIGITAQALPNVFDPFVQDAHATVFDGVGLGIGLTVVRQLVEAHGGSVLASSPGQGMGSRFVVSFPCVELRSALH